MTIALSDKEKRTRNKHTIQFITKTQKHVEQAPSEQTLFAIIDDIKQFPYPLELYSTIAMKIRKVFTALLTTVFIAAALAMLAAIILVISRHSQDTSNFYIHSLTTFIITAFIIKLVSLCTKNRFNVQTLSHAIYSKQIEFRQQLTPIQIQEDKQRFLKDFTYFTSRPFIAKNIQKSCQGYYQGHQHAFSYHYIECFYIIYRANKIGGNVTYPHYGICLDFPSNSDFTVMVPMTKRLFDFNKINRRNKNDKTYTASATFNELFRIEGEDREAITRLLNDQVIQCLVRFMENQTQTNRPDKKIDINLAFNSQNQLCLFSREKLISDKNQFTILEPDKFIQELKTIQPSEKLALILELAHDLMIYSNYSPKLIVHNAEHPAK